MFLLFFSLLELLVKAIQEHTVRTKLKQFDKYIWIKTQFVISLLEQPWCVVRVQWQLLLPLNYYNTL